jgi:hypothetical protein
MTSSPVLKTRSCWKPATAAYFMPFIFLLLYCPQLYPNHILLQRQNLKCCWQAAFSGQFYRIAIILPGEVQRETGCDGAKLKTRMVRQSSPQDEKFFALCPILSLLSNLSSAILRIFF